MVTAHPNTGSSYYAASGKTLEELSKSMSSKTKIDGNYGCFSASLSVDYNESSQSDSSSAYTRVQMNANLYTLTLGAITELRENLLENAKKDLASLDPNLLFDNYGTHFVNSLQMGGRAVYASTVNTNSFKSHTDLKVVAQASYKSLVGSLSAEESAAYSKDISSFKESSSSKCTTNGGNPSLGGEGVVTNLKAWVDSVQDFPDFVDFIDENSLQPIWNLVDPSQPARIEALKTAYTSYMKAHLTNFSTNSGPVLKYKWIDQHIQFTDKGSGAKDDLTLFKPDVGGDWYYLGQTPEGGYPGSTGKKAL
ncbi:hypothetical protein HDU91_002654, partial [Kappamyces sp. JEL0680]